MNIENVNILIHESIYDIMSETNAESIYTSDGHFINPVLFYAKIRRKLRKDFVKLTFDRTRTLSHLKETQYLYLRVNPIKPEIEIIRKISPELYKISLRYPYSESLDLEINYDDLKMILDEDGAASIALLAELEG